MSLHHALVAAVLALAIAPTAALADAPGRIETPFAAPPGSGLAESVVRLRAPLPASVGPHPEACDQLGYLRIRAAAGPERARDADAILVAMPGLFGGAASLEITGRNVVRTAAERGRHLEFWALDRRANCLEDHWGVERALARGDAHAALEYYFQGRALDGRRFGGFRTAADTAWLAKVGLAQTLRDEHTVLTRELPAAVRRTKVVCGGHSLGGPLTAAFADWDFDGDPATTDDAGYRQCAGFFVLDSRLGLGFNLLPPALSGLGLADLLGSGATAAPYLDTFAPVTPETFQLVPILGAGAATAPDQESTIVRDLPHDATFDATLRLLFSRDWASFLRGRPSIRDVRTTNAAALGAVFDDNSQVVGILRAGLGLPAGGPVAPKEFPWPYDGPPLLGLLGGNRLMIPTASGPGAPLYRWRDWRQAAGDPPLLDPRGAPYSPPGSETTDIAEFARATTLPLDLTEQYFPTRIVTDVAAYALGDRSGSLRDGRHDGATRRPALYLDAAEGIAPQLSITPSGPPPTRVVSLAGYNHLDVGTAAWTAADGSPSPLRGALTDFALQVTGGG